MKPTDHYVITPVSNPMRTLSRMRTYKAFEEHMLDSGVNLITVECTLGERPFELAYSKPNYTHVGVHHHTVVWHKESLVNRGLQVLPPDAKYISVIDCDVTFRSSTWAMDVLHGLQQYPVLQPWQHAYDLGPNDSHLQAHTSFASLVRQGKTIKPQWDKYQTYPHPGYAWSYRRNVLEAAGGLLDFAILGSADQYMAYAFLNRITEAVEKGVSAEYTAYAETWQSRAYHAVRGHIGFVDGTIEHTWHGPKKARGYETRNGILRRWHYNPATDILRNSYGIVELAGNKPGLAQDIDRYFRARFEDANVNF